MHNLLLLNVFYVGRTLTNSCIYIATKIVKFPSRSHKTAIDAALSNQQITNKWESFWLAQLGFTCRCRRYIFIWGNRLLWGIILVTLHSDNTLGNAIHTPAVCLYAMLRKWQPIAQLLPPSVVAKICGQHI